MPIDPTLTNELRKEAERVEEDALFSGKGHYNAVSRWLAAHRCLGTAAAAGSTLAGIAVLRQWNPFLAMTAAAIAALSSVVITTMKPNEEADRHQRACDRYFAIQNRARIFRNIQLIDPNGSSDEAIQGVKNISESLAEVRTGGPIIPRHAFDKAK